MAAVFLAYTARWIAKLFLRMIRGGARLKPFASKEIWPSRAERFEYRSQGDGPHGLWMAIEVHWKGSSGWTLSVDLDIRGDASPLHAQFALGEGPGDEEIDSPLAGWGITGLGYRAWSTPWGGKARLTKKLCEVAASRPNGQICVNITVTPGDSIRELKLSILAAPPVIQ